jgi:hypothetical protein
VRPAKSRRTSFTLAAIVVMTVIDACAEPHPVTPSGERRTFAPALPVISLRQTRASSRVFAASMATSTALRRCRIRRTLTYRYASLGLAAATISPDIKCLRASLAFERIIAS